MSKILCSMLFRTDSSHKILSCVAFLFVCSTTQLFSAPGNLDTTFNPTGPQPGTVSTTINGVDMNSYAFSVAIQADGKIVTAGYYVTSDGPDQFAVARFNTNGSLDTTAFNPEGLEPGTTATTINNVDIVNKAYSVALQADGKIVAAGFYTPDGTSDQFAVARFNTDGSLDTTFNSGGSQPGTVSTTINNITYDDEANSVAIQADGKIVTAGYASPDDITYQFAVARFNTDGSLDTTTFNPGGLEPGTTATTINNNVNGDNEANSVAIQADGKIVAVGFTSTTTSTSSPYQFAVARFNTNGSLDTTFNPTGPQPGTVSTTINGVDMNSYAFSVAIQADGKIVTVGYYVTSDGPGQFAVARFNTDGSPDTTFNPSGPQPGTVSTTINSVDMDSEALSVAIQADGKIVAAGAYETPEHTIQFAVARFNINGSLDTTFNPTGAQPGLCQPR